MLANELKMSHGVQAMVEVRQRSLVQLEVLLAGLVDLSTRKRRAAPRRRDKCCVEEMEAIHIPRSAGFASKRRGKREGEE